MPSLAQLVGPADFGSAILTAVSVAGLAVVGGYTFAYLAHVFFAVAEQTAAGQDDITFHGELFVDRLGKAAVLAWLTAAGLAPAYAAGRLLSGDRPLAAWIFAAAGFGLLFPLFALSAQAGGSPVLLLY